MPPAIDSQTRAEVIKGWLSGSTRAEIAQENKIGAGTVSNIINEWKKSLTNSEYESIRELAVFSKKEAMPLSDVAAQVRLNNYIQKLGANLEQIESLIANVSNSQNPQELVDTANQIAQLSTDESIPLGKMVDHIKRQQEEIQRLQDEIEQAGATLKEKNVEMQTIEQYKNLEKELKKYGLSMEHPHILSSILLKFKAMGHDPKRIVQEFSQINSMKRMEGRLKEYESRAAWCREVLPVSEDIIRLGIGIPELLALHTAIIKKADLENVSLKTAAFRLIAEIEIYENMGGLKNQISQLVMQKYAIQRMSAPRDNAIAALIRLQTLGVTDSEILSIYEGLNRMRESSITQ